MPSLNTVNPTMSFAGAVLHDFKVLISICCWDILWNLNCSYLSFIYLWAVPSISFLSPWFPTEAEIVIVFWQQYRLVLSMRYLYVVIFYCIPTLVHLIETRNLLVWDRRSHTCFSLEEIWDWNWVKIKKHLRNICRLRFNQFLLVNYWSN